MKRLMLLVLFINLVACGGGDSASTSSDKDSTEVAESTFSSKPTNKQLLALLKDSNRFDIKLAKGNGWNTTYQLRKRWHKNYSYKVQADIKEYPDATALVYGEFRFQINGSNYDLDTMRTLEMEFFGIPLPSDEKMQKLLSANASKVMNKTGTIVEINELVLPKGDDERNVVWHTAKSFSINVDVTYSARKGNELITEKCRVKTRFYRDSNTAEFNRVLGIMPKCKVIKTQPYVAEKNS